jgi:predicted SAM-dependent methyltransferase
MKTYLNLGCGQRYHKNWTNIDFISSSEYVQAHNLLQGIPFEDETFEVVYHSHLLEHFTKKDGEKFLQECYRVLKPEGIIRIAVPDLEQIAKEYLKNLSLALDNQLEGKQNYEWIMLEMYDQAVRNESGGEMAKYIFQEVIPNEDYVFSRIGEEGRNLRNKYLNNLNHSISLPTHKDNRGFLRKILSKVKNKLKNYLFKEEIYFYEQEKKYAKLGKFRLGGEIHQWMYDKYSLSKLLSDIGFKNIEVKSAFESAIHNWNGYNLESKDNIVFKPDSLFIEGIK